MKELCEMMRDLRQDHDLTQKAVAAHLGISQQCYSGYERGGSGGKFRPKDNITRQEMCRVLVNALELGEAQETPSFADSASIAEWARPQVYACYEAGLVKGDPNGRFNPRNFAKRSEAATMLQRYADSLERPEE